MWWEVIKNQELETSQLGATMDWENEVIPDKKDDECRKIIMGMIDRAKRYEGLSHAFITVVPLGMSGTVSEESICKALEIFKNLKNGKIEETTESGADIDIFKNHSYSEQMIDDYRGKVVLSGIQIIDWDNPNITPSTIKIIVALKAEVRKDKKLLEDEYQKVCEYIFEEYYNTDFKIE